MTYHIPSSGVVGGEHTSYGGLSFGQCDAWVVASLRLGSRAHDHLVPMIGGVITDTLLKVCVERQAMVPHQIVDMWPHASLWTDAKTHINYLCIPHSGWGVFFKLHES